jgi:hypothetical protein
MERAFIVNYAWKVWKSKDCEMVAIVNALYGRNVEGVHRLESAIRCQADIACGS